MPAPKLDKAIKHLLVIDLEATCCDDKSFPREETEVIEIGAVMVDAQALQSVGEFATFVQPVTHPQLTAFCTELTSIRQSDVADAPRFPEAIEQTVAWANGFPAHVFCSWGDYDRKQLQRQCRRQRMPYPLGDQHLNLKQLFSDRLRTGRRFGMAAALRHIGLELHGTHHRGIDDARNIARLLPFIFGVAERSPGGE